MIYIQSNRAKLSSWCLRFNPSEKYARQIGFIFPKVRGESNACLSCHHLVHFEALVVSNILGSQPSFSRVF